MNEHQWLVSTEPNLMWSVIKARATDAECRAFVEECRRQFPHRAGPLDEPPEWRLLASIWCSFQWQEAESPAQTNILREVFGNPFRPVIRADLPCPAGAEASGHELEIVPRDWLAWNDRTVPKIAEAIRGGRCEACKGHGGEVGWIWDELLIDRQMQFRPSVKVACNYCHGTGQSPPDFDQMPILADALVDAGCDENSELVMHCRGMRGCDRCLGDAVMARPDVAAYVEVPCTKCSGTGWLASECGHVRGCWALRLLTGGTT